MVKFDEGTYREALLVVANWVLDGSAYRRDPYRKRLQLHHQEMKPAKLILAIFAAMVVLSLAIQNIERTRQASGRPAQALSGSSSKDPEAAAYAKAASAADSLSGPAAGCNSSDVTVEKLRAVQERFGYVRITGAIRHNCPQPIGVQIKITSYDKAGAILRVEDIWPASINNIPPNSNYPFQWLDEVPGFSTFTVSVIDLHAWR